MKKLGFLLWLATALAMNVQAQGQVVTTGTPNPKTFAGAPTGSCGPQDTAVNSLNGDFYSCSAASWVKITGSGSGLADPGSNGIIKRIALNTTAISTATDVVGLFTGCSGTLYLGADGACHTGGAGTVTHTVGALTAGSPIIGNGSADVVAGVAPVNASFAAGADACAKINTAINAQVTAGGGLVYGDFATNQSCANLITVKPGITLWLAPVTYTWTANCCIVVNEGGHLIGSGTFSGKPSTYITIAANLNPANIVKGINSAGNGSSWHGGIIENIAIDGNKAGPNTTANCLDSETQGESGAIRNVLVTNCPAIGFRFFQPNGQTSVYQGLFSANAGTYGFEVSNSTGMFHLQDWGGDANVSALIHLAPGPGTVELDGGKLESSSASDSDPVFLIEGTNGEPNIGIHGFAASAVTGSHTNFIKVQGVNSPPFLDLTNVYASSIYTNLYNDVTNSITVPLANASVDSRVLHWSIGPMPNISTNATAYTEGSVSLVGGDNANVLLGPQNMSGFVWVTGPGSAFQLGGLNGTAAGYGTGLLSGRIVTICNGVAQTMSVLNEDGTATAGLRIKTPTGGTVTVGGQYACAGFQYDNTNSRWVMLSGTGVATSIQTLANDPGSPADGTVWLNTTTGISKKRIAGATKNDYFQGVPGGIALADLPLCASNVAAGACTISAGPGISVSFSGGIATVSDVGGLATVTTASNCAVNSVSPAACGSAASGAFVVPTTTTTYTVNTTAVTTASRIFLFPTTDASNLPSAPTCVAPASGAVVQSARVNATSFTFTLPSTTGTTCFNYLVVN